MRTPRPRTAHKPRRATLVLAALIGLALLSAGPAQAQWKWKDKSGQITASDLPPPRDVPEKDILQRPDANARRPSPAASAPVAAAGKSALDKEVESRKKAAETEQQGKAAADAERLAQQRAENCRRARSHVAALESGQRMARANDKGEREVLDDKGRAEEMKRANDVIASDCGK